MGKMVSTKLTMRMVTSSNLPQRVLGHKVDILQLETLLQRTFSVVLVLETFFTIKNLVRELRSQPVQRLKNERKVSICCPKMKTIILTPTWKMSWMTQTHY